jgi:hypothetical protein
VFKVIEQEKSPFKIVTKTKNERFFIEKWILHHLNILQDTKLIIFDNMSDDEHVRSIYQKYRNNIILFKFNMYMDNIHMISEFLRFYRALASSSKFFTFIDSDEYLYLYDGANNQVVKDNSIVKFLNDNTDCNFFAPCWLENIRDIEKLWYFNPRNLYYFNWGKPIVNTKMVAMFESALKKYKYPEIHHTIRLPILTYGKTQTRFVLLHLKNLNIYQRIKSNMQKLTALHMIKNDKDFSTLLKIDESILNKIDVNAIHPHMRGYLIETKKLIESILHNDDQSTDLSKNGTIELCDDGTLKFAPESYEEDFKKLMSSDYFDLINFDPGKIDIQQYTSIESCMGL